MGFFGKMPRELQEVAKTLLSQIGFNIKEITSEVTSQEAKLNGLLVRIYCCPLTCGVMRSRLSNCLYTILLAIRYNLHMCGVALGCNELCC